MNERETLHTLDIIRTFWPIFAFLAVHGIAFTVWLLKLAGSVKAERHDRIAADNRIETSVRTANDASKEQLTRVTAAIESMAKEQAETVKSLHKVELTLTEIAAYEKGRIDERGAKGRR